MFQAITEDQSATLGGVYFLVFIAGGIWLTLWFNRRFGDRIRRNQRRRQVERAFNEYEVDSSIVDDILRERRRR